MPVSGYNGTNLKEIDRTCCPFYNGPSFLNYLDTLSPLSREDSGPVRMPVLDRFKVCANTCTVWAMLSSGLTCIAVLAAELLGLSSFAL